MDSQGIKRVGKDIYVEPFSGEHKNTLIWMHGLGDSAEGFIDIFGQKQYSFVGENTKVVLLTAPTQPVTINMGMSMPSWYDIFSLTKRDESSLDKEGVERSKARVCEHIETEVAKLDGDYKRLFVGGFSQGCCMAIHIGLSHKETLGGIIGCSGLLFPFTELKNKETPMFLYHGAQDPVISADISTESYQRLKDADIKYFHKVENYLEHSLSNPELAALKRWFSDFA